MNNYEEKEKKLENVLKKLKFMSNKVAKLHNDMDKLSEEKILRVKCLGNIQYFVHSDSSITSLDSSCG